MRQLHDQRHLQRFAIEQDPVLVFAVLAEPFAVIGEKDDRRLVVEAFLFQRIEEAADDRIGRLNVGVVGRLVRRVRLVDVKEEKEWMRLVLGDPLVGDLARLIARPLGAPEAEEVRIEIDGVVPEIESALDAGLAPQNDR